MRKHEKFVKIISENWIKDIRYWCNRYPQLPHESFVLEEKIDGTNVLIDTCPHDAIVGYGSRNRWNPDHYDMKKVVDDKYADLILAMREYHGRIQIYGELFGGNVGRKSHIYGKEKRIIFFSAMVGGEWLNPVEMTRLMEDLGFPELLVCGKMAHSLQEALDFDVEKLRTQYGEGPAEGIVIKPVVNYLNDEGNPIFFKKVSDKFKEKNSVPRTKRDAVPFEKVQKFLDYINDNRMMHAFSRNGPIKRPHDIGKYIRVIVLDALHDYERENGELLPREKKIMYKAAGGSASLILRKYLGMNWRG